MLLPARIHVVLSFGEQLLRSFRYASRKHREAVFKTQASSTLIRGGEESIWSGFPTAVAVKESLSALDGSFLVLHCDGHVVLCAIQWLKAMISAGRRRPPLRGTRPLVSPFPHRRRGCNLIRHYSVLPCIHE